MDEHLLRRLDAYLDVVPRSSARVEEVGPFTLFVKEGPGWPYYARPRPGVREVSLAELERVRERQRDLGVPETFEWIADLVPSVSAAAAAAGLAVVEHPLLHLPLDGFTPIPEPAGATITLVAAPEDLRIASAVAEVGFGAPGTATGDAGTEALADAAAAISEERIVFMRDRAERGLTVTAVAFVDGEPVAVGSHQPAESATEIVGVATLPAFRRTGLGAAVTSFLVGDAVDRGVRTVFLSAGDDAIARVYERVGFRRVGHAGAAEPPSLEPPTG
jgi:ribosomal protein S18 acetylase RimI-like enzyme